MPARRRGRSGNLLSQIPRRVQVVSSSSRVIQEMGESFENLDVWLRSKTLAVQICRLMKDCRDYGLRDQITRSAVSVPSNIAEGAERNSQAEFYQFIGYAKGSLAELRTQMMISKELGYMTEDLTNKLLGEAKQLSRMVIQLLLED